VLRPKSTLGKPHAWVLGTWQLCITPMTLGRQAAAARTVETVATAKNRNTIRQKVLASLRTALLNTLWYGKTHITITLWCNKAQTIACKQCRTFAWARYQVSANNTNQASDSAAHVSFRWSLVPQLYMYVTVSTMVRLNFLTLEIKCGTTVGLHRKLKCLCLGVEMG
jgi:hypothetical protein